MLRARLAWRKLFRLTWKVGQAAKLVGRLEPGRRLTFEGTSLAAAERRGDSAVPRPRLLVLC